MASCTASGRRRSVEYRQVERDAALERRFQPVVVDEPTVEDTISILRGLRERYEVHHGVKIQDAALVAAATLAHRYITDRFLPDKAIDLVDEACAVIRTEIDSMPEELDEITRRVMQLEIEEAALKKESDAASNDRLEALRRHLADLRAERDALTARWEAERHAIHRLQGLREELEQLRREIEEAERSYDLNRAAELRHGKLPEVTRRLASEEERLNQKQGAFRLLREEVAEEEIADVVARWTGIPVSRLMEGEREKLLRLDEVLHERVIGQDEAVRLVADAVIRARAGIKDPKRPIGSFIFLGPTGVGKTELSRALAAALFDSEDNMVRLDMSEYQERHTVSRLVGAPPGYVGYEEGGQLTEAVRRKPYSVVLFDEIEKAHSDVFNTLLQILDDGRLTDAQGRTVDFRNTVVVMTSNIGSLHLLDGIDSLGEISEEARARVMGELREGFRPEFLNRVDDIVLFKPLTLEEIESIVDLQMAEVRGRLADRQIGLEVTDAARRADLKRGLRSGIRRAASQALHPARSRDEDRPCLDRRRYPAFGDDHRRRRRHRAGSDVGQPVRRGRGGRRPGGCGGGIAVAGAAAKHCDRRVGTRGLPKCESCPDPAQRLLLDLPHTLCTHPEIVGDLGKRPRWPSNAIVVIDYHPLTVAQAGGEVADLLDLQPVDHRLRLGLYERIGDHLFERCSRAVVTRDRFLQPPRRAIDRQQPLHLLARQLGGRGEVVGRRLLPVGL